MYNSESTISVCDKDFSHGCGIEMMCAMSKNVHSLFVTVSSKYSENLDVVAITNIKQDIKMIFQI